jgi:glycosyltransferase involved in cell wall biosynthesis
MRPTADAIALLYDNDSYADPAAQPSPRKTEPAAGPIGRRVAGKEFLDALLNHGTWKKLVALVRDRSSANTLQRFFKSHASQRGRARELALVPEGDFLRAFFPSPPARLLHTPCPPDLRCAWARSYKGPGAFALSGVTHTLCSQRALDWMCELVTGPFEPYDALVCTSRSAVKVIRAVTGAYTDFLRERMGGQPRVCMRLETIPLGVDTDRYRPATAEERALGRETLGVAYDETAVLFVGRLSHHTKAHPFPIYHGVAQAARATGRKVHLLMCGWAANQAVMQAFRDGAQALAANVRVTFVDGLQPQLWSAAWRAADLFTSLSDNIQETFGLVLVEAMASGLPIVATDWDGYRDVVVSGETGLLVPTIMIPGATADATARLQLGAIDYNLFLAECSQAVAVDCVRAAEAFTRLIGDEALCRKMGAAARQRALEEFDWSHVILAYEKLWTSQEEQRQDYLRHAPPQPPSWTGPARYPAPELAFAGYPSGWLQDEQVLKASGSAAEHLEQLLAMPLVNYVATTRVSDVGLLRAVLAAAEERPLSELVNILTQAGVDRGKARATLAWMLKYDLLRVTGARADSAPPAAP